MVHDQAALGASPDRAARKPIAPRPRSGSALSAEFKPSSRRKIISGRLPGWIGAADRSGAVRGNSTPVGYTVREALARPRQRKVWSAGASASARSFSRRSRRRAMCNPFARSRICSRSRSQTHYVLRVDARPSTLDRDRGGRKSAASAGDEWLRVERRAVGAARAARRSATPNPTCRRRHADDRCGLSSGLRGPFYALSGAAVLAKPSMKCFRRSPPSMMPERAIAMLGPGSRASLSLLLLRRYMTRSRAL